jgi:hypothetical protein
VDDDQFEMLNQYSWYTHSNGYAMTHIDKQLTSMHRLLTNCPKEMQVDHINCQTNDNRIVNLRICTKSQNEGNKRKMKGKSTEYKGVTERNGSYEVTIKDANNNSEYVYIGRYSNKVAAANMYNHFAKRIFGEFARLNEVPYMSPDECKLYKGEKENTISIFYKDVECMIFKTDKTIYGELIKSNHLSFVGKAKLSNYKGKITPQIIIDDYHFYS